VKPSLEVVVRQIARIATIGALCCAIGLHWVHLTALLGSDFLQPTPAAASTIASAAIQREMRSLLVGIGLLLLTEFPWLEQTGKFALSQRNGELI